MALTIGQKCVRVLRFLRGLGQPRAVSALAAHGFAQKDLEEGWELLRAATTGTKLAVPNLEVANPADYDHLDQWENYWFPIAQATLARHHPTVASELFLNLSQTSGVEVSVSVGTLVTRVRTMQRNGSPEEKEAMALLARRGLTEHVLADAEAHLKRLQTLVKAPPPRAPSPEEVARAEGALWTWYIEWSTVARQAIHDRNLLRALGFLRRTGGASDADEPADDESIDGFEDPAPGEPPPGLPLPAE